MNKPTLLLVPALMLPLLPGCSSTPAHKDQWILLFNGQDLSGWSVKCQAKDRAKIFWTVDRGTILCDSMGRKDHNYVWLLHEREFGDFELGLKFAVYRDSPGNSGVQFRSRFDDSGEGWLNGPQVDIHPPGDMPWRTGLIYDETFEERRWVFPSLKDWRMDPKFKPEQFQFWYSDEEEKWNELQLICRGNHVQTILNGVVRTDWDGTGVLDNEAHVRRSVGRRGHFALQLHSGDELRIRFTDIKVREL
jgi:hypothetical protein